MPREKEIRDVLDLLTIKGTENLGPEIAQPALQLRNVLGSRNVIGVGIADKVTSGKPTGTLALCFYVVRKLAPRSVRGERAVPATVPHGLTPSRAGVTTDVVELGRFRVDARPAIGPGISIGHVRISAGTLGALVRRGAKFELLSNSHVLALGGKARLGDSILCPGKADGGKSPRDILAKLSHFKPFVTGGSFVNTADCATAAPLVDRLPELRSAVPGLGVPRGITAAKRDMKIVKVGRTTGKTIGTVRDVHFRFVFTYEGIGQVGFIDQVLCSRYSLPGDSGSLVLDRSTRRAVGLHFASAPQGSVFSPIKNVLKEMGVKLVTRDMA